VLLNSGIITELKGLRADLKTDAAALGTQLKAISDQLAQIVTLLTGPPPVASFLVTIDTPVKQS
jgi:hypothetical protein